MSNIIISNTKNQTLPLNTPSFTHNYFPNSTNKNHISNIINSNLKFIITLQTPNILHFTLTIYGNSSNLKKYLNKYYPKYKSTSQFYKFTNFPFTPQ